MIKIKPIGTFVCVCSALLLISSCGGGGGNEPPANSPPSAIISVTTTSGYAPLTLQFSALQSSDRDGSITGYSWDFGDGQSSLGSQATHTFADMGFFSVTLTVTDNHGSTASTSVSIDSHAQAAGIYEGSILSAVAQSVTDVQVIIGANHEIFAYDWVNYQTAYWGSLNISTDQATGSLFAEIWDPASAFPDGSSFGVVNLNVSINARQDVIGTYSGVGDTGTIQAQYVSQLSERPSSMSDVGGTWTYADGFGYAATLMISSTGEMDYSDTDGWIGQGQIDALDPALNGYRYQFDWAHPTWNGLVSGLAFVDDYYSIAGEHQLIFAEKWEAVPGQHAAGSEVWTMPRPAPLSVVKPNYLFLNSTLGPAPKRRHGKSR